MLSTVQPMFTHYLPACASPFSIAVPYNFN